MIRYRKILVAYDGSDAGKNVLRQACHLAKEAKSWLKLMLVIPRYEGDLELIGVRNIRETIEGPYQAALDEAKEIAAVEEVPILTNLTQGEPYETIVHVADDENCDLIIMGRKGHSHVERALVGGVTSRVIGHTHKDVLVVPEHGVIDWSRLLVATDGSPYSRSAVEKAFEIAKERQSRISVLSVVNSNEEFLALAPQEHDLVLARIRMQLDSLQEQGRQQDIDLQTTILEGEPFARICDHAEEINASMIVMGSHGRKGLTRLLMGSVTEHVVGLSKVPVIVRHLQKA